MKKNDIKFDTSELIILLASRHIKYIDLCDILKQSQATVYKKINGEVNFSASDIYRLVKKLGIPKKQIVKYFFTIATSERTTISNKTNSKSIDTLIIDRSDSEL